MTSLTELPTPKVGITSSSEFSNQIFPVRRLSELHGKPDIVRVVSELGIVLLSYPSLLMVEVLLEILATVTPYFGAA